MSARFRFAVVVSVAAVALACSSVLDKEINRVSRSTCTDGAPFQSSQTRSTSGRVTAAWSCPAPTEWSGYLARLDSSLSGYQRKSSTADTATYTRQQPGDVFVLNLTLVKGSVPKLDARLTVGPD